MIGMRNMAVHHDKLVNYPPLSQGDFSPVPLKSTNYFPVIGLIGLSIPIIVGYISYHMAIAMDIADTTNHHILLFALPVTIVFGIIGIGIWYIDVNDNLDRNSDYDEWVNELFDRYDDHFEKVKL
jgi:hypothetical protein